MSDNKLINVGIIGSGSQSEKIYKICKAKKFINKITRFHYKQKKNYINNFNELLTNECIILASPTYTFFEYLTKLQNYKGYIFLEKPGGSSLLQLDKIYKKFKNKNIYINYNFEFSTLVKQLNKIINYKRFGKIIKVDINSTNGLVHKKKYKNWRFVKKYCSGIEETNMVHFVKLSNKLFGKIDKILKTKIKSNKTHNVISSNYLIKTKKKIIVNIFTSYDTPYYFNLNVILQNAIIKYNGNTLTVNFPRDFFDNNNRFKTPPIVKKFSINFEEDWKLSLKKSVEFFLQKVKNKVKFRKKVFKESIDIGKIIFNNK